MSTQATALPVEMNEELQKAVAAATSPEAIRAAILAEAEKQAAAKADVEAQKTAAEKAAADKLAEEQRVAAAAQTFKRSVVIAGREFEFEASSELELSQMIVNAYQLADQIRPETTAAQTTAQTVDPAVAAKAAADKAAADAAARADLELKFRRAEISVKEYLEKSGALDDYLAAQGVSIASLKQTVEATQSTAYEKSWADATTEFLKDPTNDWPGGDQNREILGMKLAAMNLTEAEDKVGALRAAYAEMKRAGLVFVPAGAAATTAATTTAAATTAVATKTNAELAAEKAAADAAAAAAALATQRLAAPIPSAARSSSSLFGASSGVSTAAAPAAAGVGTAKVDIPKEASPAEILEAWKAAQVASGVNPDQAFMDTFRSNRR